MLTKKTDAKPNFNTEIAKATAKPWKPVAPPCHMGACMIYQNFYIGGATSQKQMVDTHHVDILVPLADMMGSVWKDGWRGEIWYLPITDFSVLPVDVAISYRDRIVDALLQGKKVGMFCFGGHGRTGYMASLILAKLGIEDPIEHLWTKYCEKAIESLSQFEQIVEITELSGLEEYRKCFDFGKKYGDAWYDDKYFDGDYTGTYLAKDYKDAQKSASTFIGEDNWYVSLSTKLTAENGLCIDCWFYDELGGFCEKKYEEVKSMQKACGNFKNVYTYADELEERGGIDYGKLKI